MFVLSFTPDLPTKIIPTKIPGLKTSGKIPMGVGIPPLMPESSPLNCWILVRRSAVTQISEGAG